MLEDGKIFSPEWPVSSSDFNDYRLESLEYQEYLQHKAKLEKLKKATPPKEDQ